MITFKSILTTFEVNKFFDAAEAVANICLSLKSNHQIMLGLYKYTLHKHSNRYFRIMTLKIGSYFRVHRKEEQLSPSFVFMTVLFTIGTHDGFISRIY